MPADPGDRPPWEEVHIEACRWEHVMSESVEARLVTLLNNPTRDPHGNPIPGLEELGVPGIAGAEGRPCPPWPTWPDPGIYPSSSVELANKCKAIPL
nr:hypothetical protein GCM10020093_086770 [Planobispora longispora]